MPTPGVGGNQALFVATLVGTRVPSQTDGC